jgi:hypothetical protein
LDLTKKVLNPTPAIITVNKYGITLGADRSPTKFPQKEPKKSQEQDSLFEDSDEERHEQEQKGEGGEGESIQSSSASLFSQEDEPSDDFLEAAKPGNVSGATSQSYEQVSFDNTAPPQRRKAYKKKASLPSDTTAAQMIEHVKPKPAPKPPRSALPALIKGPSDPALLAEGSTLVDTTPIKAAGTAAGNKKTSPGLQSKTSPTTKQSDAFIDACATPLAFEAFKQAVYDPKHLYVMFIWIRETFLISPADISVGVSWTRRLATCSGGLTHR